MLNKYEQKKYSTIEKIEKGDITRKEAMYELGLSLKQIDRLRKAYYKVGKEGFIHKNRGKTSKKKFDLSVIEELERIYLEDYYDYNFTAFYDELNENKNTKINITFHIQPCIIHS